MKAKWLRIILILDLKLLLYQKGNFAEIINK